MSFSVPCAPTFPTACQALGQNRRVRAQVLSLASACGLVCAAVASAALVVTSAQGHAGAKRIRWQDTAPLRARLEAHDITSASFPSYVDRVRQANARRVREGDLDHLVFYLLQSTHVTTLPSIEPALSARALVDSLDAVEREAFLRSAKAPLSRIPMPVRSRIAAVVRALDEPVRDERLIYFREMVKATFPSRGDREAALGAEYLRVMRFVYEKEFVAQRSERGAEAVAELYRTRGLSTDTAVEAGYLVSIGLGVVRSLDPERRIRRVLVVGPGLDLAPRTALLEVGPPESYQPWAVIDALLALGLSRVGDLEVVAADINPRVVEHLRRSYREPPALTLVSGILESDTVTLSAEYRDYFSQLGRAIGAEEGGGGPVNGTVDAARTGHLLKTVRVASSAARALRAETLDVVTERLDEAPFDIVIATNILPYFDDVELMLAMTNVGRMLAPGGVLLHNEARPLMHDVTSALGFPLEQSRQAIIASVGRAGSGPAPPPLADSVWLHRKAKSP